MPYGVLSVGRSAFFLTLGQLVRVVHVVPDAVEAAGYATERIHECVAAPDGEDGVFLTKPLCGADDFVGGVLAHMLAHPSSERELYDAGNKAADRYGYLWQDAMSGADAVVHGLDADGYGQ